MSEPLKEEEVLDRAERWARLHANPAMRGRMDKLLEGLSQDDQRRVYLCGQRIAGGLPYKVLPPAITERKQSNGIPKKGTKRARPAAAK